MRRRTALGAVGLVLVVGACSTPLPEPSPEPEPAAAPAALTLEQVQGVLEDLDATLEAADAGEDVGALPVRITGPASFVRQAQYELGDDGAALTSIPTEPQTVVAPATTQWPRTVVVVTEPPEDLQAPLLLTLRQESPREQYRLWGWARLFPGIEMPATAQPEVGSPPVAADAEGLVMTPVDTLAAYLDVLSSGDESEHADAFSADPLRTGIAETRAAFTEGVSDRGSLTETYDPLNTGPYAVATADGGAIVVGSFRTVTSITLDDSTLALADETAALVGSDTLESHLTITYLSVVAFAVPPEGSTEPIRVLGGEHSRIAASGE